MSQRIRSKARHEAAARMRAERLERQPRRYVEAGFRVGRAHHCTLAAPLGEITQERPLVHRWHPARPRRMTAAMWSDYHKGRRRIMEKIEQIHGVRVTNRDGGIAVIRAPV